MIDNWLPLPRYSLRKHLVLSFLKQQRHRISSCYEVGYASGDLMISMARLGFQVYGYDFSPDAFKIAARRIRRRPAGERQRIRQLTQGPPSNPDAVVALEVLEHVRDDVGLMQQFHRILAPGGFFIFSVPAHMSRWGENDVWAGHYRRYEKKEIETKLTDNRFIPVHIWSYGYPLILLLDLMIHRNRKKEVADLTEETKTELTQKSGISRQKNLLNLLASWKIWVLPFFHIQKLFLTKDRSSAYLVIARKAP